MVAPYMRYILIGILLLVAILLVARQSKYNVATPTYEEKRASFEPLPNIYIITSTHPSGEQLPDLIRLSQTLLHVKNIVWIVAEDAQRPSQEILDFLNETQLQTVYLRAPMAKKYKDLETKPKGISNKNAGLDWIRENARAGVVFFADVYNTYDIRIFEEIRWTEKISMFPLALDPPGTSGVCSPIVQFGEVVGFFMGRNGERTFPVNYAQFALSVQLIRDFPDTYFPLENEFAENSFLKNLQIRISEIEPKANGCTQVLVWRTHTREHVAVDLEAIRANPHFRDSNLEEISKQMWTGIDEEEESKRE